MGRVIYATVIALIWWSVGCDDCRGVRPAPQLSNLSEEDSHGPGKDAVEGALGVSIEASDDRRKTSPEGERVLGTERDEVIARGYDQNRAETPDRGPTGQWPPGFPAYTTTAELTTNGSQSDLVSKMNDSACSDGCVIQHAGNISGDITSRVSGTGRIVVRPPIGQRANYSTNAVIKVSNVLLAGYAIDSGQVYAPALNSGFAWMEASGSPGMIRANCAGATNTVDALFYEIVYPKYGTGHDDRSHAWGSGCSTTMTIVGSYLAGMRNPPPAHADTLQNYNTAGYTRVYLYDSVLWSSWDKSIQCEDANKNPGDVAFDVRNTFITSPGMAEGLFPGTVGGPLSGYYSITCADFICDGCLIAGEVNGSHAPTVQNSELYQVHNHVDGGGNTDLGSPPTAPPIPTHTQLDAIWAP